MRIFALSSFIIFLLSLIDTILIVDEVINFINRIYIHTQIAKMKEYQINSVSINKCKY